MYKGTPVAVKVQRAGLKELFDTDLKNLKARRPPQPRTPHPAPRTRTRTAWLCVNPTQGLWGSHTGAVW